MNKNDFISIRSQKHMYNKDIVSTAIKTQFGKDINVEKLCEDTIKFPDEVIHKMEK